MTSRGWDGMAMPELWAEKLIAHLDGRKPGLPAWIANMPEVTPRPARPPAWIGSSTRLPRRPGKPVDATAMMRELTEGIGAIEAKRAARGRRNSARARRALSAYENARRQLDGEPSAAPSTFVAAMLGLSEGHRPEVF